MEHNNKKTENERVRSAISVFLMPHCEDLLFARIEIHDSSVEQANFGFQQTSDVLAQFIGLGLVSMRGSVWQHDLNVGDASLLLLPGSNTDQDISIIRLIAFQV